MTKGDESKRSPYEQRSIPATSRPNENAPMTTTVTTTVTTPVRTISHIPAVSYVICPYCNRNGYICDCIASTVQTVSHQPKYFQKISILNNFAGKAFKDPRDGSSFDANHIKDQVIIMSLVNNLFCSFREAYADQEGYEDLAINIVMATLREVFGKEIENLERREEEFRKIVLDFAHHVPRTRKRKSKDDDGEKTDSEKEESEAESSPSPPKKRKAAKKTTQKRKPRKTNK
jgi:hypothetical protein